MFALSDARDYSISKVPQRALLSIISLQLTKGVLKQLHKFALCYTCMYLSRNVLLMAVKETFFQAIKRHCLTYLNLPSDV